MWTALALLVSSVAAAQTFDVASIKPSEHLVRPDYNNQIRILPSGLSARNATLRRLIANAYGLQLLQVIGPGWLDRPVRSEDTLRRTGLSFPRRHARVRGLPCGPVVIPIADDPSQPVRAGGPALPVLDKTGLPGIYDFTVDARPELGTPAFSLWQHVLREQLELALESRRGPVNVVVVDDSSRIPAGN